MTQIPIYDDTVPTTCTATSDEIPVRIEASDHLRSKLLSIERTEHGLLLHFPPDDDIATEVRQFTIDEKRCCQFWGFDVQTTPDGTTLRWDRPPTVDDFFGELTCFFESDEPATS